MYLSQEDDRRIAEVQYKRCCALQFSDHLEGALAAVQVRRLVCSLTCTSLVWVVIAAALLTESSTAHPPTPDRPHWTVLASGGQYC